MQLGYFTEDAYERLLNDVPRNREKYSQPEEWLSDYFGSDDGYYKMSSVEVNNLTIESAPGKKSDEQKALEDLGNTKVLYNAFKNLTPNQASNKYLWTYLSHTKFRNYIQNRWMVDEGPTTVETRFFATDKVDSLFNDNAVSRLWWYGHLTYDKSNSSNPYALTEILFTNQTICTDVMDTLNRRNPERIKGVLLAIRDFKETVGARGLSNYVRVCNRYLNRYAAVTKMEFLDSEEIRDIAFAKFMELRRQSAKTR